MPPFTRALCVDKLARIRDALGGVGAATFNTTADVVRRTDSTDGAGGYTQSWNVVHTYACSFMPAQVQTVEVERDVRVLSEVRWKFSFALGADVVQTDRLTVGTRTFEVTGSVEGSWSTTHDVSAVEIT